MEIERPQYLNALIRKMYNGRVKVITGLRRSGKSYLLFHLFYDYLIKQEIKDDQIIILALDEIQNAKYRNPFELDQYIRKGIKDISRQYYIFIDEIQFVAEIPNPYLKGTDEKLTFVDTVLGLMKIPNADIYITGSNSKMLSSDILTQFRDRADEIRVFPLSFAEFCSAYQGDRRRAWPDYYTYGGMPMILSMETYEEKSRYLKDLFENTYIKDVLERNQITNERGILDDLLNFLSSSVGSLTNPKRLSDTFLSERGIRISQQTISAYISYFEDAFLIEKAERYDVKGKKHIKTPLKYYFTDPGLRNARLGFRQVEETHLMENVLFIELLRRGYDVNIGVVPYNTKNAQGKSIRKELEIDFIVNRGDERFYIQSALSIEDPEKRRQETESLLRVPDSFKKIVVVRDFINPWHDDKGIQYIGIEDFLLKDFLL